MSEISSNLAKSNKIFKKIWLDLAKIRLLCVILNYLRFVFADQIFEKIFYFAFLQGHRIEFIEKKLYKNYIYNI